VALRHWLQLSLTEGIGPILSRRIIESLGGAEAACAASAKDLSQIEGIGSAKLRSIHASLQRAAEQAPAEIERAAAIGAQIICPDDAGYPVLLRSIPDPPNALYVKGTLEPRDLNGIAIVGSRRCSHYGREQAERFGALLAGAGFCVISGGARGIDSAAHRGAMSHPQGRTIAVLGCGVDSVYPPENKALFEQIATYGAVMSEYPIGTPPVADNFPRRNRIVSGMSRGVLVIEADERSGALITARQACDDHGRPVFALPGRVDNRMSIGPHKLIRDGAVLVMGLEEILEGLDPLPAGVDEPTLFADPKTSAEAAEHVATAGSNEATPALSEQQRAVLMGMDTEPMSVDAIVERTTLPAHAVMQELTFLSLKGAVKRVDGQMYAKR
jgi:DNA processing protein